jgi:putative ABC transport system ATP-binding protein
MSKGFELHNISVIRKSADGRPRILFEHANASFLPGRLALVSGATGVGKTSLLYLLGGLLRPTQGEILADGRAVSRWVAAHRDFWRRNVGFVFQHFHLIADLTVFENVLLPLLPRYKNMQQITQKAHASLEKLSLTHLAGEKAIRLSGGERQRTALARALTINPRFLIADEPTAHQDEQSTEIIKEILCEVAHKGSVVIVTAHDPRLSIQGFADETYRLSHQQLVKVP